MSSSRSSHSALLIALLLLASHPAQAQAVPEHVTAAHTLRVWGPRDLGPQLLAWEAAYTAAHPGVTFANELHSPAAVMAGLYNGVADLALMGREIWPVETMAYRWVFQVQPFGIAVATAGLEAPGDSFTPVVTVPRANPLTTISLSQLDAIYGSEHRAAPGNIRTWGELGLTGAWASRPIHPYGFGPEDALGVFFRHDVLQSDFKPNPAAHLFSDHDAAERPLPTSAAARIAEAVARDPLAIGYTGLTHNPALKTIPLSTSSGEIAPEAATLASHQYPLTRSIYIYLHRVPGEPIDPIIGDFLRFLLSPAAQALVAPSSGLLPLAPQLAAKQLDRLSAPMPAATSAAASEDSAQ